MKRIGITGHQNIPVQSLTYIRRTLEAILLGENERIEAFSSLAAGADQIFAEAALACDATLVAVIPSEDYASTFSSENELKLYGQLKERAARCIDIGYANSSEEAYYAAGLYVADHSDLLIAVWDGARARGFGGTADIVRYAQTKDVRVEIVWQEGVKRI